MYSLPHLESVWVCLNVVIQGSDILFRTYLGGVFEILRNRLFAR
jgi:hypothetical protein